MSPKYVSTYGTARFIGQFVSFIGWLTVFFSGLIFVSTYNGTSSATYGYQWVSLIPALGFFVSGLFLVLNGQLARAVVDNTDNTGEILAILRASYGNETTSKIGDNIAESNKQKVNVKKLSIDQLEKLSIKQRQELYGSNQCPLCSEYIDENAVRCGYCQGSLVEYAKAAYKMRDR